jgi:signal peptidase I
VVQEERASRSGGPSWRSGWAWLLVVLASRSYLVLVASLAAIALLPSVLGWSTTVVQSGSMEPGISAGDVVLTSPLPVDADAPVGRVVSFVSPAEAEPSGVEKIRLHRIVDVTADGMFVTAGDANVEVDSTPIDRGQIIGQGRLLVPAIGLPSWWVGHGDLLAVTLWLATTALALVVVAFESPTGRHAARRPSRPPALPRRVDAQEPGETGVAGRRAVVSGVGALVVLGLVLAPRQPADAAFTASTSTGRNTWRLAARAPLAIGRASSYALLAATSVTNQLSQFDTTIYGSIATSPGTTVSGFWSWNVTGSTDRNTTVARNAKTDAVSLAAAIDARGATAVVASTLTGTIRPGVYTTTAAGFTTSGTITLDARGDSSAVFIFRSGTLTTGTSAVVRLINGARASNVYWRTTAGASLGRDSLTYGTIVANGSATMASYSSLVGRLISLNGAITVDRATVELP